MKAIGIISIAYGALGLIWGTVVSFVIQLQSSLVANIPYPDEAMEVIDIYGLFEALEGIWRLLLPFIILIAAIYILAGILQLAGRQQTRSVHMIAAILNVLWYILYMVVIQTELLPMLNLEEYFPMIYFQILFVLGMLLNGVFYCGYPVFLLIYLNQNKFR